MSGPADYGAEFDKCAPTEPSAGTLAGLPPGVFLMTDSFERGGSERQFATLASSLNPASFRLCLGCIQKHGAFLDGLGEVAEFPLGGNLYGMQSWLTRARLARHLRSSQIAIAHAFDFYTNLTLIPAARMAGTPVVIGSQRQLGDLLTPAKSSSQAAVLRWCEAVVCNSRAAAERLIQQGVPAKRLVVIPNGLSDAAFVQCPPALPRKPGLLRVGMIARMNTPSKNHRLFLRTAAILLQKFGSLEFVLAGDGPLRQALEDEADHLGIGHRVLFLGDQRDIPSVLASLDVSVLPSASESLSNVIIESMAAGVPVVATRVGGNPELVTENRGVLVPRDNEQALAGAIEQLLRDNPRRLKMGTTARQFAKANFTAELMGQRHEELYEELLTRKNWQPTLHSVPKSQTGNNRVRVGIVAASLRYVGGQSVQAELLSRHWQNDPEVQTKLIYIDPPFPSGLKWMERIPLLRTIVREPLYLRDLWRELQDVDIAHIFSASYWSFAVAPAPAWLTARLMGKKTLIHYHSGEAPDHLRRFPSARAVLSSADLVVVPSGYLVDVFRQFNVCSKPVPNIVDGSQFTYRLRHPVRPHLICTRGFHPYYCVDIVVRAFKEVQMVFPDARLDLVGTGASEAQIRTLVRELKLSGVNFCGVASPQEIGRFYNQADIFINASCLDNMPVSILEAFASGTPVVTTAPAGMRYVVEHERTGLLSEPGDSHALAQNVIRILHDAELTVRLASNAHEELRRYSWPTVREQWLEAYRSLIRRADQITRGAASVAKSG